MFQARKNASLGNETPKMLYRIGTQQFQRDLLLELAVRPLGAVYLAHAAPAEQRQHAIGSDTLAWLQLDRWRATRDTVHRRPVERVATRIEAGHQREQLLAQVGIAGSLALDECGAFIDGLRQDAIEQCIDPGPLLQDPPIGHRASVAAGQATDRRRPDRNDPGADPLCQNRIVNAPTDHLPDEIRRMAEELMPLYYADVKRMARSERRRVGAGDNTLQTTALIHEAYLKLLRSPSFNDRAHFLRASALAMRHVLINHARESMAEKRGGSTIAESLTASNDIGVQDDQSLLDIHEALERLAQLDERLAQVVECRFFAGLDEEDTAVALGVSDRTVRRDWIKARAWLRRELGDIASSRHHDG